MSDVKLYYFNKTIKKDKDILGKEREIASPKEERFAL